MLTFSLVAFLITWLIRISKKFWIVLRVFIFRVFLAGGWDCNVFYDYKKIFVVNFGNSDLKLWRHENVKFSNNYS